MLVFIQSENIVPEVIIKTYNNTSDRYLAP